MIPEKMMMKAAMMNWNCSNHPIKTTEHTSVSAKPHGKKKLNSAII